MQQIREHIASEDGTELRRAAHTLKGSAHVFGAAVAAEAAHRLEEIGREEAFADAEEALALLEDEVARLLLALRERVAAERVMPKEEARRWNECTPRRTWPCLATSKTR